MSSVKGIFPSISIKRKPKVTASASSQPNQSGSLSQIFRPLTPETTRKFGGSSQGSSIEVSKSLNVQSAECEGPLQRNTSEGNISSIENEAAQSVINYEVKQSAIAKPRPQVARPGLVHRESGTSLHDRSSSVNSETSYYSDLLEAPMIEQEDIIALTLHVRAFSEALSALRNTFFEATDDQDDDPPEVKAHERLGEVLSILKGVLNKYTPLHSTDILAAAGTLISKVKSHNYEESNDAPDEFCESIDQLALAFSSSVSDFLMGDQDMPLSGSRDHSRSLEDFCDEDEDDGLLEEDEEDLDEDQDYADEKEERKDSAEKREIVDKSAQKADELDRSLLGLEHGVDLTLQRSKIWSKYAKDIAAYLERRAHLELEFTNKLAKLAQTTRSAITEERYLPFQSIFVTSLDQDIEYAETCAKTYNSLLSTKFLAPLQARRNRHEQTRKELKDVWTKAYKKLNEAIVKLEKTKQTYVQRHQELEKSKLLFDAKDGQEPSASFSRTTKKRQDDIRKAEEAEDFYAQCVSEATVRQRELEKAKSHVLLELRQLIYQCDMTMKAVTCNYFQMMNTLSAPAPVRFQILAESSRAYEPGTQFADFVQEQMATSQPTVERMFRFEPYTPGGSASHERLHSPSRHHSAYESRTGSLHSPTEDTGHTSPFVTRRHRSLQITGQQHLSSSHPPIKAWPNREHLSDVESNGSKSAPASPNSSPTPGRRSKTEQHSELNMESSDEESGNESDDKDTPLRSPPRNPRKSAKSNRSGIGPFRDCRMSSAAMSHQFKRLRAPSKCRDCDSYVFYNGAECAQCGLTCHKKCLARLKSKCSKKGNGCENKSADYRSARRMTTFGVDFHRHLMATDKQGECVPYIVSSCVSEINSRGLQVKGIYRVSGVKSKVEKLCQAFENGTEVVDLSSVPPHVIAAVLKLYLRQLPEPLLTFNLYPEFMKIAKESFNVIDNLTSCKSASENESIREKYEELVQKLRKVVVKLPKANFKTAAKVIDHLNLVAQNEEENSMSSSNLGIVFGPTLLRPRESSSSDSVNMSALVDMPNQTRTVELLITNQQLFAPPDKDDPAAQETPVEDFPGSDRNRSGSGQSIGIRSVIKAKDMKGLPIQTIITTEDGNKLGIDNTRTSLTGTTTTTGAIRGPRVSLGFGNDFFELLAKSNERIPEVEKARPFTMPEFLLPGSTEERETGNESDVEDLDEDSNTQGTSGSQTPEDELESSRNSVGRDVQQVSQSDEKIQNVPIMISPVESPSDLLPSENPNMARRFSGYSSISMTTVSFGSDFQDPDSLLPDLSDIKPTEEKTLENFESQTDMSHRLEAHRLQRKTVDDAAIPTKPRRPHSLGLFKRNSDLPGMISRGGFFPLGVKSFGSEPDVAQKTSEKRTGLSGSKRGHPGITEAVRETHKSEATAQGSGGEPGGEKNKVESRDDAVHLFPGDVKDSRTGHHLYPVKPQDQQDVNSENTQVRLPEVNIVPVAEEPLQLESKGIELTPPSLSNSDSLERKGKIVSPSPPESKLQEKLFEIQADVIDGSSASATKADERMALTNINREQKTMETPAGKAKEGPPVAEKKYLRENGVRKGLADSDSKTAFEIPKQFAGKTADQDILQTTGAASGEDTPRISTAFAQSRVTRSEAKARTEEAEETSASDDSDKNGRLVHRVSVKDRLKQYEQSPDSTESTRKAPTGVGSSEVASRKQLFEESERSARRDSYKKLNDITKKARSNPGLDGSSGAESGSDVENRKERVKPLIGRNVNERIERLDSSSRRREKFDRPERPHSLVLENLRPDKIESLKQEKSKTTDSIGEEKPAFTSRKVDIPLDSPDKSASEPNEADDLQKLVDKCSSAAPVVRSSPKPSGRSARHHFPEDKKHEKREPQFV